MKETKTASGTPEARAAMHEMMAAFEAFIRGQRRPAGRDREEGFG